MPDAYIFPSGYVKYRIFRKTELKLTINWDFKYKLYKNPMICFTGFFILHLGNI